MALLKMMLSKLNVEPLETLGDVPTTRRKKSALETLMGNTEVAKCCHCKKKCCHCCHCKK